MIGLICYYVAAEESHTITIWFRAHRISNVEVDIVSPLLTYPQELHILCCILLVWVSHKLRSKEKGYRSHLSMRERSWSCHWVTRGAGFVIGLSVEKAICRTKWYDVDLLFIHGLTSTIVVATKLPFWCLKLMATITLNSLVLTVTLLACWRGCLSVQNTISCSIFESANCLN